MLIFILDDEALILEDSEAVIHEVVPDADIRTFSRASFAIKAVEEENLKPDMVFCDIEMPGLSGMDFAERLKKVSTYSKLIFVTAYPNYALEAFSVRPQGYLLKPLTKEQVAEEVNVWRDEAKKIGETDERIIVKCFGPFGIFYKGNPLIFKRLQTKELFAFLIDREGAPCTNEQIAARLWEDENDMMHLNQRIRNLISDMKETLRSIGMDDVLIRERRHTAIRRDRINCDYYRLLDGDEEARRLYQGEYMTDYSWAEPTAGRLEEIFKKRGGGGKPWRRQSSLLV